MSSHLLYLGAFRGKLVHKPYLAPLSSLIFTSDKYYCNKEDNDMSNESVLLHGQQDNDKPNSYLDTPTPFITKQLNKMLSRKLEEGTRDALFDGIEIKLLVSSSKYQIQEGFLEYTMW